jgi:hypothetical protein
MSRVTRIDCQSVLNGPVGGVPHADLMTVLACGAVLSAKVKVETIRETIARLVKKTSTELDSLPKKIAEISDDMERINQDHWLAPTNQIDPQAPLAHLNMHLYKQLPGLMRGWAKALTLRLSFMERQSTAMLRRGTAQDCLQLLVEESCGKECDKPVADLLQAAGIALGQAESQTAKFNEGALAKRRERRRQREMRRS